MHGGIYSANAFQSPINHIYPFHTSQQTPQASGICIRHLAFPSLIPDTILQNVQKTRAMET